MEWIIDDISEVLATTDVYRLLDEYFNKHKGKDPIVHFYETFLAEYDPKTREKRGVYYTPEPVVSYIVHSLHHILKEHFNKEDGFASQSVTVLDPAAGTLTFLAEAAKLAVEEFTSKYGEGKKAGFVKEHILKNFYAFELMMAPYAVGHLKMSFLLEELGYKLKNGDRLKFYLTNTLETEELDQTEVPGLVSLSEESHLAGKIKKEQPILVILGNPPYQGMSANKSETFLNIKAGDQYITHYMLKEVNGIYRWVPNYRKADENKTLKQKTWIGALIEDYKICDGKPLGEKNPKWLQDDYVKFIRFAQWKIDQAGEGILGFITNHSYLDNPTFRGMRQSLTQSFDEIYLLDLHGNSLKKEKCPDGSKDENVFDIQQGVAIALLIKKKGIKKKVFHSEIWGLREIKYDWLNKHNIATTKWKSIKPKSEFYFFIPRDEGLLRAYEKYLKVPEIFPINSVGIVTARDNLTIKWSSHEIWQTVLNFSKLDYELARQAYNLGDDVRDWKVELAQKDLKDSGLDKTRITPILYRPFDMRYTYYTGRSRGFHCMPRPEVMRHMLHENLGLITLRKGLPNYDYSWVYATNALVGHGVYYNGNQSTEYLFPLYLYQEKEKPKKRSLGSIMMLFEPQAEYEVKKPNLSPALVEKLTKEFKKTPSPEEIFYYIYAVLYSNIYRTKYAEFLKIDFPRVPFTKDYRLFKKMGAYGEKLVELHLLKSSELDTPVARFQGKGNDRVEKLRYEKRNLYINNDQYFEGISSEVWEYQIGGYQVCDKWLKDRRGKSLSVEDTKHYCKVVTALKKTIEIQTKIDSIYADIEKEIIEF